LESFQIFNIQTRPAGNLEERKMAKASNNPVVESKSKNAANTAVFRPENTVKGTKPIAKQPLYPNSQMRQPAVTHKLNVKPV